MPRDFKRSERVSGLLRRELAQMIQREIKDPEVGFVSVSDVEVSRDLAHAKVFVTVFNTEQAKVSIKALKRAAGFLRTRLGQELSMRSVPQLHFQHDDSVETGQRMDSLIDRAVKVDQDASQDDPAPKAGSEPEK
jgi:ribosome-binding factor A